MAAGIWSIAVEEAVRRHTSATGSAIFTRQALIDAEMQNILIVTKSSGPTPHQTLSRELQQLRDLGIVEFVDRGTYRLVENAFVVPEQGSSKAVFVVGSHSIYADEPERFYRFPARWMANAVKAVGNWIIYQEPRRAGKRGYYAVAKFYKIVSDPTNPGSFLALIEPGSFLEFGRDVSFRIDGQPVERGLLDHGGRLNNGRAVQSIRLISNEDFDSIVGRGLVDEAELLPRVDDENAAALMLQEDRVPWDGPVDRATMLVNRTVRDRQFRKRVLDVYESTCALTGMRLINGGGRAETQAAHIMSVKAGGPDVSSNGIALSGTVHWMFDRGLISLGNDGDILLSRKINDIESVERLIFQDRKARLPKSLSHRPHPRYLEWHREECFHN